MHCIRELRELNGQDIALVGGKAASLAEMMRANIPVPPGFVVLADADLTCDEILSAFDRLNVSIVAVRSSATVEDAPDASWAGQFETYLGVTRDGLVDAIQRCRDSAKSARVNAYRAEQGADNSTIAVAVIVQAMVDADAAGVCFTVHPVTKNPNHLIIEACLGLGDKLVGGEISPDSYIVDKLTETIIDVQLSSTAQVLSNDALRDLARLCKRIEDHYGFPCDVEWAHVEGSFSILQSRPITTL